MLAPGSGHRGRAWESQSESLTWAWAWQLYKYVYFVMIVYHCVNVSCMSCLIFNSSTLSFQQSLQIKYKSLILFSHTCPGPLSRFKKRQKQMVNVFWTHFAYWYWEVLLKPQNMEKIWFQKNLRGLLVPYLETRIFKN